MRHLNGILLFLFFGGAVFSQSRGIIQCDPGSTAPVPAWSAPGKPHVVEQLPCGQTVSVLGIDSSLTPTEYSGRPRAYAKIQIAEKAAYVDARRVKLLEDEEPVKVSIAEEAAVEKQTTKEDEEQRQWQLIEKDRIRVRDEALLNPIVINGPRTFSATLTNNSEFSVSDLRLLVRLYDCSEKPRIDDSKCEIIGETKPVVSASIPPGQTRRITAPTLFEATPRVNGHLAWGYWILGIRAE
jgi:hypothetical protein